MTTQQVYDRATVELLDGEVQDLQDGIENVLEEFGDPTAPELQAISVQDTLIDLPGTRETDEDWNN